MEVEEEPVVCLDVGGVIAKMFTKHDGGLIFKAVDEGFVAFMLLLWRKWGLKVLHFVSRTKSGQWHSWHHSWQCWVEAYVVRLIRSTRLEEYDFPMDTNVHLTSERSGVKGKGPIAGWLHATVFVDNDWENLWSVSMDPAGNAKASIRKLVYYDNDKARRQSIPPQFREVASAVQCFIAESWRDIAALCDLTTTDKEWESLCQIGPPHAPFVKVPSGFCLARRWTKKHKPAVCSDTSDGENAAAAPKVAAPASGNLAAPQDAAIPVADSANDGSAKAMPPFKGSVTEPQDQKLVEKSLQGQVVKAQTENVSEPQAEPSSSAESDGEAASRRVAALVSEKEVAEVQKLIKSAVQYAVADALASESARRRLAGGAWYDKKRQRAESHQRSKEDGRPHLQRLIPRPEMCKRCGKGQPGSYCCRTMCGRCCHSEQQKGSDGKTCDQHILAAAGP